jgi:SSS family solute:Na+ symporter
MGCLLWVYYNVNPGLLPDAVRAKPDQVFAYFIGHQMPAGISGIILAGILAAAMSTIASDLNCLGAVLYDDFYIKLKKNATEGEKLWFSKLSVLASGALAILLAMALTKIESMVEAAFSFSAIMQGGLMGLFALGFFTTRCSTRGVYAGLVVGVTFIVWATYTSTMSVETLTWFPKYKIHIYWLGLLGNLVVFVSGYLFSLILTPGYQTDESLTVYAREDTPPDAVEVTIQS